MHVYWALFENSNVLFVVFVVNPIQGSIQFLIGFLLSHSCYTFQYQILLGILVWFTREVGVFYSFEII
jgi:hypothetical protein